ncbi:hypothetical protein [Halorubrum distributum]|uniref:Uncharacterized protein n=1 Tax=Halorubrum distributum JCM 13916 TaxID=1230455 RepID=M0PLZ4_9EURY|nr:hypothetical protein [Halorubrum arcis]EMA71081.1 hypothetical protein C462_08175 [Halorubrum arcis JCM 13916]
MSQQTLSTGTVEQLFNRHETRPELWIGELQSGRVRQNTVHVTPPVDPEYRDKLVHETGDEIAEAITELIEKIDAPIEVLTYPRPVSRTDVDTAAVLCHAFHISPHFVDGRAIQADITDFNERVLQNVLDIAHEKIADSFPDVYNVEVGDLDLDPIATGGPTATCRLVNEDAEELAGVGKVNAEMMEQTFDALTHAREPFVHQLIVEPDDGKNYITSRLAALSSDRTYQGDRGLARLVKEGASEDFGRLFKSIGLTSNYNIDIEDYLHIKYDQQVNGQTAHTVTIRDAMRKRYDTKFQHRRKIEKLKEVVLGHPDFRRLLNSSTGWKQAAEDHGYYGRFWIPPAAISYFTKRYAHYYDIDPWTYSPVREAPEFTPRSVRDIDIRTDWETPGPAVNPGQRHQTDGTDAHLKLGDRFITFARARGDEISRVEQDGESLPDQELTPDEGYINTLEKQVDSDVVNVEPEYKNESKPANILTNVERAIAADRHVILVCKSESAADRVYDIVYATYNEQTEHGVQTYQGDALPEIDGQMLVTAESESTWCLTPDGMLVYVIDGEIVTRCPADADLTEVDHGCATAQKEDGRYIVTTRGDETLTYESRTAFKREWSRVTTPHVPIDISYLQYVTIMYETGAESEDSGDFVEYNATPEWERAGGKMDRYKEFGSEVKDTFLTETSDTELTTNKCHSTMMGVYRWCTSKHAPDTARFGEGLPEIDRKDTSDGKKALVGYNWVFPRGLVSPHLAGVDADADLSL